MNRFRTRTLSALVTLAVLLPSARAQGTNQVKVPVTINTAQGLRETYLNALDNDLQSVTREALFVKLVDPNDERFGATLQPVSPGLRAQLNVPAGQGLVVASLRADGPAAKAGLRQNDVLLTLADKPLATPEDLGKQLEAAGKEPVPLHLLRGGEPRTLRVRPVFRVTLGPAGERKTEFYLGVNIDPVDDALRAQTNLPQGRGVIVNDVVPGSPAEKAGVQKYDVLLELGGKPIEKPEALAAQVQAVGEQPTTLKLVRAGKPLTLTITAATRPVETASTGDAVILSFNRYLATEPATRNRVNLNALYANDNGVLADVGPAGDDVRARLERVEKELKAIHVALERLGTAGKGEKKE